MAYPITRQFGPNAKGSELTFTDMDFNLLYLESKVTGSSNYITMYSGSTYLTSSVMYQLSGKIGIGTTNPYSIFNVVGTTTIGYPGVSSNSHIQFWPNISGESAYYIMDSGSVLRIGTGEKASGGTDVINIASTNVGIGTGSPSAKLEVVGATILRGSTTISGSNLTISNSYPRLLLTDTDSDSDYSLINDNGGFTIYDDTNTAPRIYILPSGNVGINKFAPNASLDVNGNTIITGSTTLFNNGGTLELRGTNHSYIQWYPDNSTRRAYFGFSSSGSTNIILENENASGSIALITNNGFIGINKYTPTVPLDVNGNAIVTGSLTTTGNILVSNTAGGGISLKRKTATTAANENIGAVSFSNGDVIQSGVYSFQNVATTGGGVNSDIRFYTTLDDEVPADTFQERMRINYQGRVGIGITAPTNVLHINGQGRATNSAWATTSDMRLKENIVDYDLGLNELIKIRTIRYNYKSSIEGMSDFEKSRPRVGILAQEIEKILPNTITKIKENGFNDLRLFSGDEITFLLINSIKEQQTQIEELKLQVATLISGSI